LMLLQLANHNDDIRMLLEKGYAISFDSNYLVVRDTPYLDENKALKTGAIVSKVVFTDRDHVVLEDHQIFFCGSHPCEIDGTLIKNLGGGTATLALEATDIIVERSFSNKPSSTGQFQNFFDKIESYVSLFSGPAIHLYSEATPYTFRAVDANPESVFKFNDTLTSRAEIGEFALKFKEDVIAIIGLGGTGAYILDFLAKTPVKEIRAFDSDLFHIHNAYRSPGRLDEHELGKSKAEVYKNRYDGFRHGVNFQSKYILTDSEEDLKDVTFAFVCVDKGSRAAIFDLLIKMKIPFIDVGMGLNKNKGSIDGMIRTTYYPPEQSQEMLEKKLAPMHDDADDVYKTNIQLSEINALNACLAVMRFKQLRGFYFDDSNFTNILFTIHDLHATGE
jgi:ThiF family